MGDGWFGITRRRGLALLLFFLLIAPIPLMDIAQANDPHASPSTGPNWTWLLIVFVLMGSALRGNRSALGLWAVLCGLIGVAFLVWGWLGGNDAVRLLGGFLGLAASIAFALLRSELGAERKKLREALRLANARRFPSARYFLWASSRDR